MADKDKSVDSAKQTNARQLEDDPNPAVYVGAALTGSGRAVGNKLHEWSASAQKAIEPGDMNLAHSPHPVDGLEAGAVKLVEPGDMNLAHSPHPVDAKLAVANKKIEDITAAGSVEGTAIAVEAAVTAVIEIVDPGKKVGAVADVIDDAADLAKHGHVPSPKSVEGEFLPNKEAGKGLEASTDTHVGWKARQQFRDSIVAGRRINPADVDSQRDLLVTGSDMQPSDLQATNLKRVTEAVKHPFQTVVRQFSSAEQILLNEAHQSKPGLLDRMDSRYHGASGAEENLMDEHQRRLERAQAMGKAIKENPEMEALVKSMDPKALRALINDPQFDERLGLPPMQPRLPPAENMALREAINNLHSSKSSEADRLSALERESARSNMGPLEKVGDFLKAHITSPGGAKGSQHDVDRLALAEKDSDVLKTIGKGIVEKYVVGKTIVAGAMAAAAYEMSKSEDERSSKLTPNQRLAELFDKTAGSAQKEKEALKDNPQLKSAYESYHHARDAAYEKHPVVGGRSDEASSEIHRAKQGIMEGIRNGELDKKRPEHDQRSSIDALTPDQKVAAAAQYIQTLPEHQRVPYQQMVAEYANKSGLSIEETTQKTQQRTEDVQLG